MKIAELFVRLTVDQKGLSRGLTDAQRSLDKFGRTAGRVAGVVGAGLFAGMVKQSIDAQNELARLNAVLASTGGAAGKSVGELTGFADALQKATTFSSGDTQRAMGRLLTYTALTGEMFDKATVATLDMASALGIDVAQAAEKVGNALQYPSVALGSLAKQGFRFTEEQKRLIKHFESTGQMAKAQAIILGELDLAYEGSAKAARNTLGGALIGLKNEFNSLLTATESSTRGIAGALNALADEMPAIRDRLDIALEGMKTLFRRFKRDIMALKLGEAWANAQLQFWSPEAAKNLENARKKFWAAQDAIDPLTLPGVFVDAPKGTGGGKGGGGDPASAASAAAEAWKKMTGSMGDLLALQGAMKEAGMSTLDVDNQILAAYHKLNAAMARGVQLTNEQLAAAIRLKTELAGAMSPQGGNVGITPAAGGSHWSKIKVKGTPTFTGKDQWGNKTPGMFSRDQIPPKLDTIGDKMKAGLADVSTQLISGLTSIATSMMIGGGGRGSQIGGWAGGMLGGAMGGAMMGGKLGRFGGPLGTAAGAIVGTLAGSLFGGLFDKKKKVASGLDMMATQLARVNQQLRNIPSGYKVNRMQYDATIPDGPPPTSPGVPGGGDPTSPGIPGVGGPAVPGGANFTINGPITVMANNTTQMLRELERVVLSHGTRGGVNGLTLAHG